MDVKFLVLVAPLDVSAFVRAFFPPSGARLQTNDRTYHVFKTFGDVSDSDLRFQDLDGDLLVETKVFSTLEGARAWVEHVAHQRAVLFRPTRGCVQ